MKGKATQSRRRSLIAAAGLLAGVMVLASAVLVGSGAVFTTSSANPANVFTSGVLTHTNDRDSGAILSMSLMKPGDQASGTVSIQNTGDLSGDFSLSMTTTTDLAGLNGGHLLDVLQLTIVDGATVVYDGSLDAFTPTVLGTYAPTELHTFGFTVLFPDGGMPASDTTGDNSYQGSSTTVEFDWTAVQH